MLDYLDILQVFRAKRKQCNLVSRIFIYIYIYICMYIKVSSDVTIIRIISNIAWT